MWNDVTGWNSKNDNFQTIDWQAAYEESDRLTKEKWAKLPPVVKGFYKEHDEVRQMSQDQVDKFRLDNNNIQISHFKQGDTFELPKPCPRFEHSFHNHEDILQVIAGQKFVKPSPIQAQAWPILLQGKDLIGIAQTGTGKTLAYLLPGLLSIVKQTTPRPQRPGPSMLVMAPTRELAQQIDREAKKYSYQGIKSVCIYGGGSRRDQLTICREKPEIVIATPGRLNDLTMSNELDLTAVNYLVLDEADRMLDMGFMPQIRKIMVDIRPERQTVMMSATWPPGVRKIATDFMDNPIQIFVGSLDLAAVSSVTQEIVITEQDQKRRLLYEFILKTMNEKDKAIVFVGRKSVADDIGSELALNDIKCACMHGDRDQEDRERALADLKSGEVKLIIATDVASRGLDIDDITYILNYDFPSNAEEYVHRVGRTGRAGRSGKSITFFTREDWRHAQELIDILNKSECAEIPEELTRMAERYQAWLEKKRAEDELAHSMGGGFGGPRGGGHRDRYARDGASDRNCYNCQQPGHMSRDCPQPRRGRQTGERSFGGGSGSRGRGGGGGGTNHTPSTNDWGSSQTSGGAWGSSAPGEAPTRGSLMRPKQTDGWSSSNNNNDKSIPQQHHSSSSSSKQPSSDEWW